VRSDRATNVFSPTLQEHQVANAVETHDASLAAAIGVNEASCGTPASVRGDIRPKAAWLDEWFERSTRQSRGGAPAGGSSTQRWSRRVFKF
jgi:hypothetical protein